MRRFLAGAVVAALLGGFTFAAGPAYAEPEADFAVTVLLYDCSGPPGTPSEFYTEKIPVGGAMTHVVGTTLIYKRTIVTDLTAGWTVTWGPFDEIRPLITCSAIAPNGHELLVTGFFTGSPG